MGTKRKNRFWSDAEKRSICQQTTVPGVSIAQVAQRYTVNANLIHKWLKDRRFAPPPDDVVEGAAFLPVEIDVTESVEEAVVIDGDVAASSPTLSANRIDITLSDGRRILVEGPTALASVVGLVQGLTV